MSGPDEVPETLATYLRLRGLEPPPRSRGRRKRPHDDNEPFTPGRDPRGIGDVLTDATRQAGWEPQLAREDLVRQWADVAGAATDVYALGVILVQCDSTAWAKQLQLMRAQILSEIVRRHPAAGVEAMRFLGPDVPSWKWGPRAVPGRGPRDTYG